MNRSPAARATARSEVAAAPITVAVVSWNTRDLLERCLRSLEADSKAGRVDVWVIDNASSDGSPDLVRDVFPWASLVASTENLGFGRAVNEVAARTQSAWLSPANADVAVTPGAFEALLAAAEARPDTGVVAPRLIQPDGSTQHSVHPFPTIRLAIVVALRLGRLSPRLGDRLCLQGRWDATRPREVDWAHGALLLVRREAFDAAGRFDPRQWMYAEDLDLAWRLRRAGWRTRYEPAAVVHHEVGAAVAKASADRRVAWYAPALYAWMARSRGVAFTRTYALISLAGAALRLALLRPWLGASPGPRRRAYHRALRDLRFHRLGLRRRRELLKPA